MTDGSFSYFPSITIPLFVCFLLPLSLLKLLQSVCDGVCGLKLLQNISHVSCFACETVFLAVARAIWNAFLKHSCSGSIVEERFNFRRAFRRALIAALTSSVHQISALPHGLPDVIGIDVPADFTIMSLSWSIEISEPGCTNSNILFSKWVQSAFLYNHLFRCRISVGLPCV